MGNQAPVGSVLQAFTQVGEGVVVNELSFSHTELFTFPTLNAVITKTSTIIPISEISGSDITEGILRRLKFSVRTIIDAVPPTDTAIYILDMEISLLNAAADTVLFTSFPIQNSVGSKGTGSRSSRLIYTFEETILFPLSEPAKNLQYDLEFSSLAIFGSATIEVKKAV